MKKIGIKKQRDREYFHAYKLKMNKKKREETQLKKLLLSKPNTGSRNDNNDGHTDTNTATNNATNYDTNNLDQK